MKTIYLVIQGMVSQITAFECEDDAKTWVAQNQPSGEALELGVQAVTVYPNVESAPKGF